MSTKKTVIVTGAATGIGFETAKALLSEGYRVEVIGRNSGRVEAATKELGGHSSDVSSHICDLRKPEEIKNTVDHIVKNHKGIYGLINNAGIYPFGGIENTSLENWQETMDVNLRAPFLLSQAVLPVMSKNAEGGRIINISSTAGILPNHFALAYSVAKAALIQFTKTLAKEVGKNKITVNCVCPGIVRTPLHDEYHQSKAEAEEFYARRGATFPVGRVGEPADISNAINFYLDEKSSWITGDVMTIDGGRLLI